MVRQGPLGLRQHRGPDFLSRFRWALLQIWAEDANLTSTWDCGSVSLTAMVTVSLWCAGHPPHSLGPAVRSQQRTGIRRNPRRRPGMNGPFHGAVRAGWGGLSREWGAWGSPGEEQTTGCVSSLWPSCFHLSPVPESQSSRHWPTSLRGPHWTVRNVAAVGSPPRRICAAASAPGPWGPSRTGLNDLTVRIWPWRQPTFL